MESKKVKQETEGLRVKKLYRFYNLKLTLVEFGDPVWVFAGFRESDDEVANMTALVSAPSREVALELCKGTGFEIISLQTLGEMLQTLNDNTLVDLEVPELPKTEGRYQVLQ